jgi:glutamate-1-semialdehyde aminotransferase
MGQTLMDGWLGLGDELSLPLSVNGFAPIGAFDFNLDDARLKQDIWTLFLQEAALRGVLFRRGGLNFITFSHKEEDIQQTLDVCRAALEVIKRALEKGDVAVQLRTRDI